MGESVHFMTNVVAGSRKQRSHEVQSSGQHGDDFLEPGNEDSEEDPDTLHPISDARQEWGRAYTGSHRCRDFSQEFSTHAILMSVTQPAS